MLNLFDLTLLILCGACAAWLWRGHGIRERAVLLARQHCERQEVQLLDDNVALRRLALLRDARGQRRLARVYGFEFTVTGEQRLQGSISMFGQHLGSIQLDPHPFPAAEPAPVARTVMPTDAKVIQLADWRRSHPRPDERRQP